MRYNEFCKKYKPTSKQLFGEFFNLFKDEFSIKNQRLAVEKLEKIINSTFELSLYQSFANMSLRQLSQVSGISMGGLYAYIQNKEHLSSLINQFLNTYVFQIIEAVEKDLGQYSLQSFIKIHVYISDILQPWFFFVFMESKNMSKAHRTNAISSELKVESRLLEIIKRGHKQGLYNKNLSAKTTAALIKPLFHEWYLKRWKYRKRKISIEQYCENVIIFIEQGLLPQNNDLKA
ncbi:MAG TPA: TetR/AcrR family transcriptional regulator [Oceanospirillales bacterium]|nr:TetR/AcrR family transcriptional regulator [Oceanospirillales bacterium]